MQQLRDFPGKPRLRCISGPLTRPTMSVRSPSTTPSSRHLHGLLADLIRLRCRPASQVWTVVASPRSQRPLTTLSIRRRLGRTRPRAPRFQISVRTYIQNLRPHSRCGPMIRHVRVAVATDRRRPQIRRFATRPSRTLPTIASIMIFAYTWSKCRADQSCIASTRVPCGTNARYR